MKNAIVYLNAFALFLSACASFRPKESGPPANKVTRDLVGDNIPPVTYNVRSAGPNPYQKHLDYVELYHMKAIAEMERGGVPASIILAQGILESNAGQSDLATKANNHFGIKCGSNWNGESYKKKDDDRNDKGELIESCFRKYEDVAESFYDHSEFLRDPRKHGRYGALFNLDRTDYRAWARGLQAAGYATAPDYADKLIAIIERYNLNQYDRMGAASAGTPAVRPPADKPGNKPEADRKVEPQGPSRIGRVNDVKVVLSKPGESLQDIARLYKLNPNMVANYNDRGYTPGQTLPENTRIYIMPKKDSWNGRATHHFVREGQTMFDIAQLYGVRLDKLRQRNNIRPGFEPVTGEKIRLKSSRRKGEQPQIYQATPGTASGPGSAPSPAPQPTPGLRPTEEPLFTPEPNKDPAPVTGGSESLGNPALTGVPYPADPTPATPFDPNPPYSPPAPAPSPAPAPTSAPTPTPAPAPAGFHLVERGDTLFSISRRYGLSVAQLKKLNNMTDDTIKIGQTLKIR